SRSHEFLPTARRRVRPFCFVSGARLHVARQAIFFEHIDHALRDIDERGRRWFGNAKIRDETSSRASVRNGDGSIRESLVPLTHSRRHDLVTLPARRDKMPLVMLTDGDALRIADMQLRDGKAFPVAERNFAEALVHAIVVWRKAERTAHKFHRLAGAPKRARNVIEVGGNAACKGKKTTKDVSTVAGLAGPPPGPTERQ